MIPLIPARGMRLLALVLVLAGCGGGGGSPVPLRCDWSYCGTLEQHSYVVHEPDGLAANAPLLILLHGASVSLEDTEAMWQGKAFADRYGYRLLIPQGQANVWNYGSDVGFIADLIDTVQRERGAASAVFVAGWSNGAILSQVLACDQASRITAVVSLAGPLPFAHACSPARPVGVALIAGTADTVIPISGGVFGLRGEDEAFQLWQNLAQCSGATSQTAPFALERNGLSVTTSATGCRAPVQKTVMQGAGHRPGWDTGVLHPLLQDFFARASR